MKPSLYLALDIAVDSQDRLAELPAGFETLAMRDALTCKVFDGLGWTRTWRAFTDRDKATEYAQSSPTIVLIPLTESELVSVDQVP